MTCPSVDPPEPVAESPRAPDGVPLEAALYLVSTPIGNAGDIGARARDVLARADLIACEDTRVTGRLLSILGLRRGHGGRLLAYNDHNAARRRPRIREHIKSGGSVALVSDAGTPLVSDPGYKLVADCIDEGLAVTAVPGPSAPLTALVLSGLPTDRFFFQGFLPAKGAARRTALAGIAAVPATLVFMESAPRLAASLADMARVLGPRPAAVARELTKKFEEVRRGTLDELAAHYADAGPPRGEICVVVGPPAADAAPAGADLDALLTEALARASLKDAAAEVAAKTGLARKAVYARALELKAG
ncbi:MAG: 16S rRNA (cytidine(1402)-2'-O)-methyltransferase [Rhodospirillales bacterium CG15_BIG_FIL_POST_REV_8_21_14_020_66_15]|nr:MAG: 16S rRNA (cytidine(1402)-2'-O)-methyltransferase [Rhodospirillales bacterium CG15_BIG_FIL_POST_REV_8_21_14_020_66_15]